MLALDSDRIARPHSALDSGAPACSKYQVGLTATLAGSYMQLAFDTRHQRDVATQSR